MSSEHSSSLCNSSHFIKELPSIFCCQCGILQCNICNNIYIKCESCEEFCCNICSIKLLCNHTYCSLKCILKNSNKICTHRCFFLRDINSTGSDDYGLKNLLNYWCNSVGKDKVTDWLSFQVECEECEEIKDKIIKLKYLL